MKNEKPFKELIEAKRETEHLRNQIKEIQTDDTQVSKTNNNLPSFLKDNSWVGFLQNRVKENK
jgi:hypothetical protein